MGEIATLSSSGGEHNLSCSDENLIPPQAGPGLGCELRVGAEGEGPLIAAAKQ